MRNINPKYCIIGGAPNRNCVRRVLRSGKTLLKASARLRLPAPQRMVVKQRAHHFTPPARPRRGPAACRCTRVLVLAVPFLPLLVPFATGVARHRPSWWKSCTSRFLPRRPHDIPSWSLLQDRPPRWAQFMRKSQPARRGKHKRASCAIRAISYPTKKRETTVMMPYSESMSRWLPSNAST